MRHHWRLDALDAWRKEMDVWRVHTDDTLGELTTADKIAEAVAAKMSSTREVRFTKLQTAIAGLALLAAFSSPIIALVVR